MITLDLKAQKNAYDEFANAFKEGLNGGVGIGFCLIRDDDSPRRTYLARASYGIGGRVCEFCWEDDWWEGQPCTLLGIIYDEELLAYALKQRGASIRKELETYKVEREACASYNMIKNMIEKLKEQRNDL